jgi:hypothetical protein
MMIAVKAEDIIRNDRIMIGEREVEVERVYQLSVFTRLVVHFTEQEDPLSFYLELRSVDTYSVERL